MRSVAVGGLVLLLVPAVVACGSTPKRATTAKADSNDSASIERAPAPEPLGDDTPEVIVKSSFETSAFALKPGSKFLLVAHFKIHDGYRISWKNPGDVGKATQVHFKAPEAFAVSEVMYPRPQRFLLNGELVSYGYQGETALFAEVDVPHGLDEQVPYRFEMDAEWFACKKECATERTNAFFELLVDPSAPRTAMDDSLTALLETVPTPVSELERAKHRWQASGAETELSLSAPKVEWLDFYPAEQGLPKLLRVSGSKKELKLSFEVPQDPPEMLEGLAIAKVDGSETTFEVELPWGK